MKAKEKARELIEKLKGYTQTYCEYEGTEDAKQCALICVDERIKLLEEIRDFKGLDISWIEKEQEVKKEIENL